MNEPIGYIAKEMLARTREYERNGIVIYDRPLGTSTMPLYAKPLDSEALNLLRDILATQKKHYGDGMRMHMAMIDHAKRIEDFLAQVDRDKS